MRRAWIFMLASLYVVWGVAIWAYFRLLASTRKRDSSGPGKNEGNRCTDPVLDRVPEGTRIARCRRQQRSGGSE